jgi:hypothetical protein
MTDSPTPILHRSKRIADQLAMAIQAGRQNQRQARGRSGNGEVHVAYTIMLADGSTPAEHSFSLLAHAIEDEELSVAEVFGELLDDDLVDMAYALDVDLEPAKDEPQNPKEPNTLREALSGPERAKWRQALIEEFQSIADLGVFRLIARRDVPAGRRIFKGRIVFKIKCDEHGDPIRWKARWVVQGFLQVFGLDYDKTTSPTARLETFRVLCHIMAVPCASSMSRPGELPENEQVFMEQLPGFEDPDKPDHVWLLVKALYGMKQAGRWMLESSYPPQIVPLRQKKKPIWRTYHIANSSDRSNMSVKLLGPTLCMPPDGYPSSWQTPDGNTGTPRFEFYDISKLLVYTGSL